MYAKNVAEIQMECLWEYISRGAMAASLDRFRSLGMAAEVLDFVLEPSSYAFPQEDLISSQNVKIVPENKIAVLALKKRQIIALGSSAQLHTLQKESLVRNGFSPADLVDIQEAFGAKKDIVTPTGKPQGTASVRRSRLQWSQGFINAKPAIVFNLDDEPQPVDLDPSMTLHEFVHLAQILNNAYVGPGNTHQQDELEAYSVQAASVTGDYRVPYTLGAQLAVNIEIFRKKYIGENSYVITPEFLNAIKHETQLEQIFS